MHGKCGATYESGSLRRYHLGRTETIRSCTLEALKFAQAMAEEHNQTSSESKYQLFTNAMQAHRQYTSDVNESHRKFLLNFIGSSFSLGSTSKRNRSTSVRIEINRDGK